MSRKTRKAKIGAFVVMGGICLLLTVYFTWEVLYQEPTIVKILTFAKIRQESQKEDLEELIKDWMNTTKIQTVRKEREVSGEIIISRVRAEQTKESTRLSVHSEIIQKKTVDYDIEFENPIRGHVEGKKKYRDVVERASTEAYKKEEEFDLKDIVRGFIYDQKLSDVKSEKAGQPELSELSSNFIEIYEYQRVDPETMDAVCVNLKSSNPVPICVYPAEKDVYVSAQIINTGIWEEHIVRKFEEVLEEEPTIGFLDIGANLGLYSLVAANMGHRVLAIEPSLENIKLFQKAIKLSHFTDKITILRNAVAERNAVAKIITNSLNQGDTRVDVDYPNMPENITPSNTSYVKTITLDDLAPFVNFSRAVIKIDVQGFEHIAFLAASKLLDWVDIPYIFMEWVLMREFYITDAHESPDKDMVDQMLDLLDDRGYTPFSLVSGKQLKIAYWYGWPEDVLWRKK